jgi:hypothetical protein
MPTRPSALPDAKPSPSGARQTAPRWLLFVPQLSSGPSNLRVRTWRRLQQLGAIAVRQAVYVLPDSPAAREDFEWLKTEIEGAGGGASIFSAGSIDAWSDDELVQAFRRSRQEAYTALSDAIDAVVKKLDAPRRRRSGRAPSVPRLLERFRQRFVAIERVDFFGSAGRDRVATLLAALEERQSVHAGRTGGMRRPGDLNPADYRRRVWLTRPRPGVDRMSSAWLIRRFIDPDASFGFVFDRDAAPPDAVPFDMFGIELTHRGEWCTFETLCNVFGIDNAAVQRLAGIVHDLDLKDDRFGAPDAPTIGALIDGLQLAYTDDHALLEQGIVLFEAWYRSTERAARLAGPRAVAGRASARARRARPGGGRTR